MSGLAINEDGDVGGKGDRSTPLDGAAKGYIYQDSDSTSYILEDHTLFTGSTTPGLSDWETLRTAWGINGSGQIVGDHPNSRAYLLTPVPEPAMLTLFGLVGTVIRRRRS